MIEHFIDSISESIINGLSKLDNAYSLLFSFFLILIVVFAIVIVYMYKHSLSSAKSYGESILSVHEKSITSINTLAESNRMLANNIEHNSKLTDNLSNLIINKLL